MYIILCKRQVNNIWNSRVIAIHMPELVASFTGIRMYESRVWMAGALYRRSPIKRVYDPPICQIHLLKIIFTDSAIRCVSIHLL